METATVTTDGETQTVRLPKGYHLATATVQVRHDGDAIVLEPLKPSDRKPLHPDIVSLTGLVPASTDARAAHRQHLLDKHE
jgi:virulence-associated protein VagC